MRSHRDLALRFSIPIAFGGGGRHCGGLRVALGVERQVVGAGEAALAVAAAERLRACVLTVVPRQLVGACESPFASFP